MDGAMADDAVEAGEAGEEIRVYLPSRDVGDGRPDRSDVMQPAALFLSVWLVQNPQYFQRSKEAIEGDAGGVAGTRVIELGSGRGLPGLVAALLCGHGGASTGERNSGARVVGSVAKEEERAMHAMRAVRAGVGHCVLTDFNASAVEELTDAIKLNGLDEPSDEPPGSLVGHTSATRGRTTAMCLDWNDVVNGSEVAELLGQPFALDHRVAGHEYVR